MLAARLAADAIPGMAAGVVCGEDLAWSSGYGVTALQEPVPVTPATRFRIASITKLFTATAIMKLAGDGTISLDDAVRDRLPWFTPRPPPDAPDTPVTIRQLLAHTSGLPRDSRLTDFARRFQPGWDAAVAAMPSETMRTTPGAAAAYSNLGYGVLGEIIAGASSLQFGEYVEREILAPLGMVETLVHPTPCDEVASGHGVLRPDGRRARSGFWELRFATPAGGMASSVLELSRFIVLQLAPSRGFDPPILSPQIIREMQRVHHMVDPARGGYGLGWGVEISHGQHVVYHGGELPEQTSFLLIDLNAHIGVIVLTNAQNVDASGIAQEILWNVRTAIDPGADIPSHAIPPG
jgi:CubicO group peptidase (beta-lactamase class C family)